LIHGFCGWQHCLEPRFSGLKDFHDEKLSFRYKCQRRVTESKPLWSNNLTQRGWPEKALKTFKNIFIGLSGRVVIFLISYFKFFAKQKI